MAGQSGERPSLKRLVEARQGGRAETGAEHWRERVQGPQAEAPTGALGLLRLRLQRGKRRCVGLGCVGGR